MFCPTDGFKSEELVKMGKAEDFLKPHFTYYAENFNLTDINQLWENGTFQGDEFNLLWRTEDGTFLSIHL